MKKLFGLIVVFLFVGITVAQVPTPKTAELAISVNIPTYSLLTVSATTLTWNGLPDGADDGMYPAAENPVTVYFEWCRDAGLPGITQELTLEALDNLVHVSDPLKGIVIQNAVKLTSVGDWASDHWMHVTPGDVETTDGNHVGSKTADYTFEYINQLRPDGGGEYTTTAVFTLTST